MQMKIPLMGSSVDSARLKKDSISLKKRSELKFEDKNNLKNNTSKHCEDFSTRYNFNTPEAKGKNKADEILEVTIDKNFPPQKND